MEKKIEDYLHYYVDQIVLVDGDEYVLVCAGKDTCECDNVSGESEAFMCNTSSIKPILRRLDSMTEEEAQILESIKGGTDVYTKGTIVFAFDSDRFDWALKQGFDLFGLCDAGLAIDKATIKL